MSIWDESYDEQQLRLHEDWCDGGDELDEEGHYWFTINEFAFLISEYGIEKVLADVNKRRLQEYGSSDRDVLIAGPSGDKGTQ